MKLIFLTMALTSSTLISSCGGKQQAASDSKNQVEVRLVSVTKFEDKPDEYVMILSPLDESAPPLPMMLGRNDAQALVVAIEKTPHDAPLPLDLLEALLRQSDFTVNKVVIDTLVQGVYAAEIHYSDHQKQKVLKARCCDAITISVKLGCPVYITRSLLHPS